MCEQTIFHILVKSSLNHKVITFYPWCILKVSYPQNREVPELLLKDDCRQKFNSLLYSTKAEKWCKKLAARFRSTKRDVRSVGNFFYYVTSKNVGDMLDTELLVNTLLVFFFVYFIDYFWHWQTVVNLSLIHI